MIAYEQINAGATFFISESKCNSVDGFIFLDFVDVGAISEPLVISYEPLKVKSVYLRGRYSWRIGKIRKPKRTRFGRMIWFA